MEVTFGPIRLTSLFHEVADLLQPQAEAKNVQLKLELPSSEPHVETDDQKLRQVLINLAGNAIKFTRHGTVTLRLKANPQSEAGVLLQVEDTGIGIPPDKLEAIFEAFRQADSSTTREFGGTGLGLTISRSLVQLLGGKLVVTSEEGKGSCFTVQLPLRATGSSEPVLTLLPAQNPPLLSPALVNHPGYSRETCQSLTAFIRKSGSLASEQTQSKTLVEEYREVLAHSLPIKPGQKILVVDDDPDARELISQFVQDLGASAISCPSPKEVLRLAAEEAPDLITLDLMMPEQSGWEVLAALKADPHLGKIPVMIVSIVADRRKAISLGAVDALSKPILRSEFNASVQRSLRAGLRQLGKVLVVDDDLDARNLMCAWLESEVSELKTATNGQEALALLEVFRPDVIFLDLQMPVMDGPTFLRHLRAEQRFADLPVIVITAKSLELAEKKKLQPQVSRILSKGEVFA
jgi:CheY-like chemotaxis protein